MATSGITYYSYMLVEYCVGEWNDELKRREPVPIEKMTQEQLAVAAVDLRQQAAAWREAAACLAHASSTCFTGGAWSSLWAMV
jgi:hypothetical protein